jgi:WD40 repeat protein
MHLYPSFRLKEDTFFQTVRFFMFVRNDNKIHKNFIHILPFQNVIVMESHKFHVFLSYNTSDKPTVEKIARQLVENEIEPWFDVWKLVPGELCQEAIERALQECETCAVFIGPDGIGPWQNQEMRAAIYRRVTESKGNFRVIPVILPGAERVERSKLPPFLILATWVEFHETFDDSDAFRRLISGIRGIEPGPDTGIPVYKGESPYQGLEFFDIQHEPFFFGREELTKWLLYELRPHTNDRFLAIIGSSGSGKSSLIRAGLIAALKKGGVPGSESWQIAILRPDSNPLKSLSDALADSIDTAKKLSDVSYVFENPNTLHDIICMSLHHNSPEDKFVIFIDQFEEIFTLCKDDKNRQAMINNLIYAATVFEGQTVIILAMRADFYGKCASYQELAAIMTQRQFLVGGLKEKELRRAITYPAYRIAHEFEPGLVDLLMQNFKSQAGSLPLLQYTLLELWRKRAGRRLTVSAYREIGGIKGALNLRAEEVFKGFNDTQKQICKQVFLKLTQLGEGTEDTKRRVPFSQMMSIESNGENVESVIQTLSGKDARLIIRDRKREDDELFIEVSHEALIRGWKRLGKWLDEDREFLIWKQSLQAVLIEWKKNNDKNVLLRGGSLSVAEQLYKERPDDLDKDEKNFIRQSIKSRQRKKIALLTIFTVIVILSAISGLMWYRAEEKAEIALSREIAAHASAYIDYIEETDEEFYPRGLLLSAEAYNIYPTFEARRVLARFHEENALFYPFTSSNVHTSFIKSVAFGRNNKILASGSNDNTIIFWNVDEEEEEEIIAQLPLKAHKGPVQSVAFSHDSKILASGSDDTTIILWDVDKKKKIAQLKAHKGPVQSVAFSHDSKILASGSDDTTIILWDVDKKKKIAQLTDHKGPVQSVTFSHDSKMLASGSDDTNILLWNIEKRKNVAEFTGHIHGVVSVAFNNDSTILASASENNKVILWDVEKRQIILEEFGDIFSYGDVDGVAFGNNSKILASCSKKTITLFDLEKKKIIDRLRGHNANIKALVFNYNDTLMASGDDSNVIILWDVKERKKIAHLTNHIDRVTSLAFSHNSKILASGSDDKTIILWDIDDVNKAKKITDLIGHEENVNCIAFNHDSTMLASGSDDKTIILWDINDVNKPKKIAIIKDTSYVRSIAFNHDSTKLVSTGDWDDTVILWDVEKREKIAQLKGHSDVVRSVAFSHDGTKLASGSDDDTMIVWDVKKRQKDYQLKNYTSYTNSLSFSHDSKRLAFGSKDNTIEILDVDPELWVKDICKEAERNFTFDEWQQYLKDKDYRKTCPEFPVHPSVKKRSTE